MINGDRLRKRSKRRTENKGKGKKTRCGRVSSCLGTEDGLEGIRLRARSGILMQPIRWAYSAAIEGVLAQHETSNMYGRREAQHGRLHGAASGGVSRAENGYETAAPLRGSLLEAFATAGMLIMGLFAREARADTTAAAKAVAGSVQLAGYAPAWAATSGGICCNFAANLACGRYFWEAAAVSRALLAPRWVWRLHVDELDRTAVVRHGVDVSCQESVSTAPIGRMLRESLVHRHRFVVSNMQISCSSAQ